MFIKGMYGMQQTALGPEPISDCPGLAVMVRGGLVDFDSSSDANAARHTTPGGDMHWCLCKQCCAAAGSACALQ
jgi:hypothetical protein